MREAQALLEARYDAGLPPSSTGGRWTFRRRPNSSRPRRRLRRSRHLPVDARGLTYTYAFIGIKRLGAGQFYLITIRDKDGDASTAARPIA